MSKLIRIEFGGKNDEAWNRVFEKFTKVVERTVDGLIDDAPNKTKSEVKELAQNIADITKGWVKAKLEKPEIDNEVKLVEIAERFEKIKMLQVQRELAEVELANKRLELMEKRIVQALKWLGFFMQHAVRDKEGNLTILLSNEQLDHLQGNLKSFEDGNV